MSTHSADNPEEQHEEMVIEDFTDEEGAAFLAAVDS